MRNTFGKCSKMVTVEIKSNFNKCLSLVSSPFTSERLWLMYLIWGSLTCWTGGQVFWQSQGCQQHPGPLASRYAGFETVAAWNTSQDLSKSMQSAMQINHQSGASAAATQNSLTEGSESVLKVSLFFLSSHPSVLVAMAILKPLL